MSHNNQPLGGGGQGSDGTSANDAAEQQKQHGRSAGGRAERNDTTINLTDNATIHTSGRRGWMGVEGEAGGEQGDVDDNNDDDDGGAEDFSSEKEMKES